MSLKKYIFLAMLLLAFFQKANCQKIMLDSLVVPPNSQNNRAKNVIKPLAASITLNYQQNYFFVYFHSKNSNSKYIYWTLNLDGNIKHYEVFTTNNYAYFTNLPAGEFVFYVRDEAIKGSETAFTIKIDAPFWFKWWFPLLVFLMLLSVAGLILYIFFLYRFRQKLRTQLVRDNIARDLHDDMGSYLSSISILSQNVENLRLKDPEKARASLQKIGEIARQVMDTMGDIVWSINPMQDSMEQIVGRMKDFGNELFFSQEVEVVFLVSDSIKKTNLSLENRRDFFLIYKEALTNIQKYANATTVRVELMNNRNQITMLIKDNGKGFEVENLPKNRVSGGNGLKNMKARAEKLGGKLEIISKIEEGTSVKVVFES
jgi:two-component sensor histidine kinase